MRVAYLDVVNLIKAYMREKIDLESFRDSSVEMRLASDVDSNAMKLLGQIEARYADFSDVEVPESFFKKELSKVLEPEKWSVLQPSIENIESSQIQSRVELQDLNREGGSSNSKLNFAHAIA